MILYKNFSKDIEIGNGITIVYGEHFSGKTHTYNSFKNAKQGFLQSDDEISMVIPKEWEYQSRGEAEVLYKLTKRRDRKSGYRRVKYSERIGNSGIRFRNGKDETFGFFRGFGILSKKNPFSSRETMLVFPETQKFDSIDTKYLLSFGEEFGINFIKESQNVKTVSRHSSGFFERISTIILSLTASDTFVCDNWGDRLTQKAELFCLKAINNEKILNNRQYILFARHERTLELANNLGIKHKVIELT